jgi:glycosyltransferase involved in cell wall biosynthesis
MTEPVGVAQVVYSLEVGGLERVVTHLAMHLSPRYRSTVVCLTIKGPFAALLENAGIEVIALGKQPGKDFRLPGRLAQILRDRRICIVHAHNSGPMFTGTWAAKRAGCRVVVTDHSRPFPERRSVIAAEYVLARIVDELVSVSEDNKRDLIDKLLWPPHKIRVIHNGVEEAPPLSPEQAAALRAEFNLRPDVPTLLMLARLEKQKNVPLLLDAAALLKQRGLAFRLLIVGGGTEQPTAARIVAERALADRVTLAGVRLEGPQLYRLADVMVLPSNWEGLPMCVLEAMSAGVPIVATGVGDVPKAVIHEHNGLIVPPQNAVALADALAALMADPARRQAFGAAGREIWQRQFCVEHMVSQYEALYARYE